MVRVYLYLVLLTHVLRALAFMNVRPAISPLRPLAGTATPGVGFLTAYKELEVPTKKGIFLADLTQSLREMLKESGVKEGSMTVLSRHTTCGITINEMEGRLVDDIRQWLLKLAPPEYPYLHNDLHLRSGPPGWPGGDEAWRAQEPINCHSHLLTMLLGSSESVPIHKGELKIGTWQSVILAELDGPRTRKIAVQITGTI